MDNAETVKNALDLIKNAQKLTGMFNYTTDELIILRDSYAIAIECARLLDSQPCIQVARAAADSYDTTIDRREYAKSIGVSRP